MVEMILLLSRRKKIRLRFMMMREFRILKKIKRNHRESQMTKMMKIRPKGKTTLWCPKRIHLHL